MLARLGNSKLVRRMVHKSRPHDGGANHSSEKHEEIGRVLLEFLDDEAKLAPEVRSRSNGRQLSPPEKFEDYVLKLAAWLKSHTTEKNSSNKGEVATEQLEVEEADKNLSSEDQLEIEVGLPWVATLSGAVDPRLTRQRMPMDERSNIPVKSTQYVASSSNSVADHAENLPQQTQLTQLADPQLQLLQSPNGSQHYHAPQQLSPPQHPLQSAHVNHLPGMASQMMMAPDAPIQSTCYVPLQSSSPASDPIVCYEDPTVPTTRQEQTWRSQPQGP